MSSDQIIEGLQDRLFDLYSNFFGRPQGLSETEAGFAKESTQVKGICKDLVRSAIERMDLVTREEFDAQVAVLARVKSTVEDLEKKVSVLEDAVLKKETP